MVSSRSQYGTFVRFLLAVGVTAALLSCATDADGLSTVRELVPTPELSPLDVVDIQLRALGNNNERDEGVSIAFRFASPANRLSTGPVERFAAMIKGGEYGAMLNYERFELGRTVRRGEQAIQRVTVYAQGYVIVYDFYLSKQTAEPYADCWMVDAVLTRSAGPGGEQRAI